MNVALKQKAGNFYTLRYLPLGGLIAAMLIFMDGVRLILPLLPDTAEATGFLVTTISAVIVCTLFFAIWGILSAESHNARFQVFRFGGALAGISLVAAWLVNGGDLPTILMVICGLACGIGLANCSMAWCLSITCLGERQALKSLALACLAAGVIKATLQVFSLLLDGAALGVIVLAVIFVGLTAAIAVPKTCEASESSQAIDDTHHLSEMREESTAERTIGMVGRNWVVFCGFLLCITVAAGIWSHPLLVGRTDDWPIPDTNDSVIGFIIGAVLLLLATKLVKDDTLRMLYTALPLISVASLIIVWFLRSTEVGVSGSVNLIPLGFSAVICGCLHVSSLNAEARRGLPSLFVFGLFMAVAAGVFLAWFGIWSVLGPEGASAADLVVKVVYLVAVAVQLVLLTQRQPILASKAANVVLSEVCNDLTERFSLSSRESEILYYLIQGRSYAYVAERQFVSINTVKTHAKRIYTKTGAHSKQELLNLVHSDQD